MNILEHVKLVAKNFPNQVCMQMRGKGGYYQNSYQELMHNIAHFAKQLKKLKIKPQSRIIILSESIPQAATGLLAIFDLNCIAILLDPSLPKETLTQLAMEAKAVVTLVSDKYVEKISTTVLNAMPVLLLEQNLTYCPTSTTTLPKDLSTNIAENTALVIFTSGTSGVYRGVMISHQAIMLQLQMVFDTMRGKQGEMTLHVLPFNHIAPVLSLLGTFYKGGTVHLIPYPDAQILFQDMLFARPTFFPAVPRILELLVKSIDKKIDEFPRWKKALINGLANINLFARKRANINLGPLFFKKIHESFGGRLACFLVGAAPLSVYTHKRLEQFGFRVFFGYGLTETTAVVTMNEYGTIHFKSVGKPLPGVEIKINNPDPNGEGEILIKTSILMLGYFNDEIATKTAMNDGWFHTGDIGYLDKKNYLYITGRLKEIIVTDGGKKAAPIFIEEQYGEIEGVMEYVVLGVPIHEKNYDTVYAGIVIDPTYSKDSDQAKKIIKENFNKRSQQLPTHLRIQSFFFLPEIPKTTTLKPKRAQLRNIILASMQHPEKEKKEAVIPSSDHPITPLDELKKLIRKNVLLSLPQDEKIDFSDTQSFYELGMDSLALTELYQQLQAHVSNKIFLPPSITNDHPTVENLAYAIMETIERKAEIPFTFPPLHKMQTGPINPVSLQQQYWLLRQAKTDLRAAYISLYFSIKGKVDFDRFKNTLLKIAQHQEILRTTFISEENTFKQRINNDINFLIDYIDFSKVTDEEKVIKSYADEVLTQKCDYTSGPLGRCSLLHLPENKSAILLAFHHLIFDGLSVWILLNQLNYFFWQEKTTEKDTNLPIQYADFALWQQQAYQGEALQPYQRYWTSLLEGSKAFTFPYEHASNEYQSEVIKHLIPSSYKKRVRNFIEKNHGTEFCVYYLAFLLTAAKSSNQYDITMSVPQSGRFDPQLNNVIGFIASTCLSRFKWDKNDNLLQIYQHLHQHLQDIREFYIPIQLVQLFAKTSSINTAYHVIFSYMKPNINVSSLLGFELDKIYQTKQPFYHDSVWYLLDYADQVIISCTYNHAKYGKEQISKYLDLYMTVLSQIINDY